MPRTQEVSPPHAAALESARQIEFDISGGLTERERERIAQIISQHYAPLVAEVEKLLALFERVNAADKQHGHPLAAYFASGQGNAKPHSVLVDRGYFLRLQEQLATVRGEL